MSAALRMVMAFVVCVQGVRRGILGAACFDTGSAYLYSNRNIKRNAVRSSSSWTRLNTNTASAAASASEGVLHVNDTNAAHALATDNDMSRARYRARVAYDGTHFQGFQSQSRSEIRTVQVSEVSNVTEAPQ
jgi:hypothetical protein